MKLQETDLEQSFFQPVEKRIDKTVGYVVVGLFVVLFFSVLLLGIQRVQDASNLSVTDPPQSNEKRQPEISDFVTR